MLDFLPDLEFRNQFTVTAIEVETGNVRKFSAVLIYNY